eukprot:scaffold44676_cov20-Tisochrysis_lutea.AAC.4
MAALGRTPFPNTGHIRRVLRLRCGSDIKWHKGTEGNAHGSTTDYARNKVAGRQNSIQQGCNTRVCWVVKLSSTCREPSMHHGSSCCTCHALGHGTARPLGGQGCPQSHT